MQKGWETLCLEATPVKQLADSFIRLASSGCLTTLSLPCSRRTLHRVPGNDPSNELAELTRSDL